MNAFSVGSACMYVVAVGGSCVCAYRRISSVSRIGYG